MKKAGNSIYDPQFKEAEGLLCSLCGKQKGIPFKDSAVCEDCLEYVKSNY